MPCFTIYTSFIFSHFFYFHQNHRKRPRIREKGRCCVTAHLVSQQSNTPQGGTTADTWAARISMIGPNELRLSSTSVLRSREREFGYYARLKLQVPRSCGVRIAVTLRRYHDYRINELL